ncbi:MAG: PEP/pyruvate-binding domain-containing protein, partial [Deltaproteobacteria bacterium]|nr:PEP/pyruvate-binding domain-containing protein [Deltaproteobacteria bacterium]
MNLLIPFDKITKKDREFVGGKALALAAMAHEGIKVPDGVCISALAYQEYITSTGLAERIFMELNRKNFTDMRWEEMWDASLRISNMFLNTLIPQELEENLRRALEPIAEKGPMVVRSSSLEEDSSKESFAGLHKSYVNVRGISSLLDHIKSVWASLWSDAALLYRQELLLSPEKSAMAVIVQELVQGDHSGVAFGQNPRDESQAVIEAVYGLNQGLVDGTIEPDRWIIDRATGRVISHTPALREKALFALDEGVQSKSLPLEKQMVPPLNNEDLKRVYELIMRLELLFGVPQDVEWTKKGSFLYALQARPITTPPSASSGDKRQWYLSLRRSFSNLVTLRKKIEQEHIP